MNIKDKMQGGSDNITIKHTKQLLETIEETREHMIEIALQKGFQNQEVIKLSQKLDQLLNEYDNGKKETQ